MSELADALDDLVKKEKERKKPMRIMIALPDNHPFFHKEFVDSLINIQSDFYRWKIENDSPHELSIVCKGSVCLDEARNSLVRLMIENDQTHIFFMDTDQTFLPETVRLMIEVFENNPEVDAVSGLYTWKKAPFTPHLYGGYKEGKFYGASQFPLDELFEVQAAGTGILMIKREVFERTEYPWFKFEFNDDGSFKFGEDLYFFRKAKPLTICDPRNRSKHLKLEGYGIDDYVESNEKTMKEIAEKHGDLTKHQL
jgi:hypothetical protein